MALINKTQLAQPTPAAPALPSKYPAIPGKLAQAFPEFREFYSESERLYRRIREALVATSTDLALPVTQLQKSLSSTNSQILAISRRVTELGEATAIITQDYATKAYADGAVATATTTLTASINGVAATVVDEAEARAEADGYLEGHRVLAVNANGVITGVAITSASGPETRVSDVEIMASTFRVTDGATLLTPFSVANGKVTINGQIEINSVPLTTIAANGAIPPITYIGAYASPPSSTTINEVYKNTTDGNVYIRTSGGWALYVPKGEKGDPGDGQLVVLIASHNIVRVDKSGTASPSSITVTALPQNLTGSPTFSIASGTGWTSTPSGSSTTVTYAANSSDSVTINVTWDGQQDNITIVKLREGTDGVNVLLSNEAHTIACDTDGTPVTLSGAATTVVVYIGTVDDSANWSVSTSVSNCAVSVAGKTVTVTSISADNAYVDITVSKSGYPSVTKRFSLSKSKTGATGATGSQGAQGPQGIQGPSGSNGQTSYFHIAYANTDTGEGFNLTGGAYVGTYVDFNSEGSTEPAAYAPWKRFAGIPGEQGIPGQNGLDGETSYLHIKYATGPDANNLTFTGPSGTGEDPGPWFGQYVDFDPIDSSDINDYSWKKIEGAQGPQGPQGNPGVNAKLVVLTSDAQVFQVSKTGAVTPSQITFTATGQSLSGSPTFKFIIGGVESDFSGTGNTRVLTYAGMTVDALTVKVSWDGQTDYLSVAKVREGTDGSNGQDGAAGAPAVTALLSNEAHTVPCDVLGNPLTLTGAETTWTVYLGATNDSSNWSGSVTASSGCTYSYSAVDRKVAITGMSSDAAYVDVTLSRSGYASLVKRFSLSKSKTGAKGDTGSTGATGATGPAGANAKLVVLTSDAQVFQIAKNGTVTPSAIVFTANGQNLSGNPVVSVPSGKAVLTPLSSTSWQLLYTGMDTNAATIAVNWDGLWDYLSVAKVREGSDGAAAVTGLLSNEVHSVPCDTAGTPVSFTGASTTWSVFVGATDDSANWTAWSSGSSGCTFSYSASTRTFTVDGISADSAYIDITMYRPGYVVVVKRFSLVKTRAGNTGPQGQTGATGERGSKEFVGDGYYVWSNAAADAVIAATGLVKVNLDRVTLKGGTAFAETRVWSVQSNAWLQLASTINGNLLVNGTILGDKLNITDVFSKAITVNSSGYIQSSNYNPGAQTGYRLDASGLVLYNGTVYASAGSFTGSLYSSVGYFGNSSAAVALGANGLTMGTSGVIKTSGAGYNSGSGIWMGYDSSAYKMFIGNSAGNKLLWDGSSLSVTGTVNATAGTFSGSVDVGSGYNNVKIDTNGLNVGSGSFTVKYDGAWQTVAKLSSLNGYASFSGNAAAVWVEVANTVGGVTTTSRYGANSVLLGLDTNLYRTGANSLKTDGNLTVGDWLDVTSDIGVGGSIMKLTSDGWTPALVDGNNPIAFKWDGADLKVKIGTTEFTVAIS